jgi:signal transduction histidine kinase
LRLVAGRRLAANDIGRVLPAQQGALPEILKDVESRVVAQPAKDAELSHISGLQTAQSLYAMPLVMGLDLFGVMFFAHPDADFFTSERCELVDIVARQVMVALQNAQLYEALNEEKERIVHIQEQTRKQLARSLHDGPTQSVAAIAMRTNLARRLAAKDPAAAGEELYRLEDLARRTTKEIRHMLFTLRPQTLETSGLPAALADLAAQTQDSYELIVRVEAEPDAVARVDLGRQNVLFYIAAEAITNARRHAEARQVLVKLGKAAPDVVFLEVRDDGQGFTASEEQQKRETDGALGLETLRERVELINAIMRLDSAKGRGTQLRVWVPLNDAAADRLRRGEP